jgi:SAM-dependent methyltransferase
MRPADVTSANRSAYDQIAVRYSESRRSEQSALFDDLLTAFLERLPPAAVVVDLGCGPGFDAARLALAGTRVFGLDLSAGMLSVAAPRLAGRLGQADMRWLPLATGSMDGIWSRAALLHVPEPDTLRVLAEMRRVLRPGGHLGLVTALGEGDRLEPVPYAPDVQRWFVYRHAAELGEQLRDAGFEVLRQREQTSGRHWMEVLACRQKWSSSAGTGPAVAPVNQLSVPGSPP